jgi:hypothetical protein
MPLLAAFAAALMLVTSGAPAFAQTPEAAASEDEDDVVFDRDCMDDYGRDLCDQGIWTGIVSRLGLDRAELAQRQGLRGVRVFTIDGYSNDMPAVSILASTFDRYGEPENAELEVRRKPFRDESKAGRAVLKMAAGSRLYKRAADLQQLVTASPERAEDDEDTAKRASGEDEVVVICLHAWVTVTESLTDEGVTRRIRNACGSDPLFKASFGMSAMALRGFPHCNRLDPKNYRNESTQLQRCFSLEGTDKVAAAEVTTLFDASINAAADLGPYLAPDVRLTRPDRTRVSGAPAVQSALADAAFKDFDLYAGHLVGATDRVVASGWLDKYIDDGVETADIEFVWRRRDRVWRIADIVIGPLKNEN